jgi:hypothetical protein
MSRTRSAWFFGIALLVTMPTWNTDVVCSEETVTGEVVTGTLIKLDLTAMKGLVQTDLGRPIFFDVTKPHLFERLSVGERVTLELDSHGAANKIIDASMAEFVLPPSEELLPEPLIVS